MILELVVLN